MAKIDINALRKKYEEMAPKKAGDNSEFLKNFAQLSNGVNKVRILPPKEEGDSFFAATSIHRIGSKDNIRNVHCLKVHGKNCPICDVYFDLWKKHKASGAARDAKTKWSELARSIRATPRFYLNVLVRSTNEVKILSCGQKLQDKIILGMIGVTDEKSGELLKEGLGDVTDPKEGYDLIVMKKDVGGYPNYDDSTFSPKPSKLGTDAEIAKYMDELHDIKSLVKLEDYDKVKEIANDILVSIDSGAANAAKGPADTDTNGEDMTEEEFIKNLKG